jgi:hypothetical protein
MGGIDLLDLRTEVGISQMKYLRDAVYSDIEAGRLIVLNIKYTQRESGLSVPLLENPSIHISYLTPTWITSLRQYLFQHNLQISLTDTLDIKLNGKYDQCIMNSEFLLRYTPIQQLDINLVRLHLQVTTLSDMATNRTSICTHHYEGNRRPDQQVELETWPRQQHVTPTQKRLWKRYIASNYIRYGTKWRNPIDPPALRDPDPQPTEYPSLAAYLNSLPTSYQRLLFTYEQESTDLEIWRAFRSKQRLTIATDGSLLLQAGTSFGWKLTTMTKPKTIFHGSGPIDGPIEIGSSTRSELGGFTGPLLLVSTLLAR